MAAWTAPRPPARPAEGGGRVKGAVLWVGPGNISGPPHFVNRDGLEIGDSFDDGVRDVASPNGGGVAHSPRKIGGVPGRGRCPRVNRYFPPLATWKRRPVS